MDLLFIWLAEGVGKDWSQIILESTSEFEFYPLTFIETKLTKSYLCFEKALKPKRGEETSSLNTCDIYGAFHWERKTGERRGHKTFLLDTNYEVIGNIQQEPHTLFWSLGRKYYKIHIYKAIAYTRYLIVIPWSGCALCYQNATY